MEQGIEEIDGDGNNKINKNCIYKYVWRFRHSVIEIGEGKAVVEYAQCLQCTFLCPKPTRLLPIRHMYCKRGEGSAVSIQYEGISSDCVFKAMC